MCTVPRAALGAAPHAALVPALSASPRAALATPLRAALRAALSLGLHRPARCCVHCSAHCSLRCSGRCFSAFSVRYGSCAVFVDVCQFEHVIELFSSSSCLIDMAAVMAKVINVQI